VREKISIGTWLDGSSEMSIRLELFSVGKLGKLVRLKEAADQKPSECWLGIVICREYDYDECTSDQLLSIILSV